MEQVVQVEIVLVTGYIEGLHMRLRVGIDGWA